VADLLPASFAALGAVVGFMIGGLMAQVLWSIAFGLDSSDIPPIVIGGLGGAMGLAWLGLRLSRRFANRIAKPS
jgi:hypothetical protein